MRLRDGSHLTYCTNIHPGERWAEVRANLERHVVAVKQRVCPDAPFGVGLRLSGRAADELAQGDALRELQDFLAAQALYVFTINGFPHGTFHGTRVKERVYLPDWRDPARVAYSDRLGELLAALLPDDIDGSVSTVPGAFRAGLTEDDVARIAANLIEHVTHLVRLRERTGRTVALALEPEPACLLENTAEVRRFFATWLYTHAASRKLADACGLTADEGARALRRHLGVCLDACHAAVEFEEAEASVVALQDVGIPIHKVQLSAGLRVPVVDDASVQALDAYAEDVYLHQVVERRGDELVRYVDLPDALATQSTEEREWRVHFHVPVFHEHLTPFESTQPFLAELLAVHAAQPITRHLEVETYTWDVLPQRARGMAIDEAVARELRWVLDGLEPA
jgi:hypothetical protein